MAATAKKRGPIESKMGRPCTKALNNYPQELKNDIQFLREDNEGWGAISILIELEEEYDYSPTELPSADSVHRFLKQEGFIAVREPKGTLPVSSCTPPKRVHEQWEMDAQGASNVKGLGYHSMINIKDGRSKKYCMAFPVTVKNRNTQPSTIHYKWALRVSFVESGLPKRIQVDKDSVFIENSSRSPFPSRLQIWLLALGVELCFIDRPPPAKNSMVERSHQTLEKQAVKGKEYKCWGSFFANCNKRRKRLNEKYPSRSLKRKAPLQAFPKAAHSGRHYEVKKEKELLKLYRIYNFLEHGQWYRKVSSNKGIRLGGQRYYLHEATPKSIVNITFCKKTKKLIFRDVNELNLKIAQLPIKGISKEILMETDTKTLFSTYNQLFKAKDFSLAFK